MIAKSKYYQAGSIVLIIISVRTLSEMQGILKNGGKQVI